MYNKLIIIFVIGVLIPNYYCMNIVRVINNNNWDNYNFGEGLSSSQNELDDGVIQRQTVPLEPETGNEVSYETFNNDKNVNSFGVGPEDAEIFNILETVSSKSAAEPKRINIVDLFDVLPYSDEILKHKSIETKSEESENNIMEFAEPKRTDIDDSFDDFQHSDEILKRKSIETKSEESENNIVRIGNDKNVDSIDIRPEEAELYVVPEENTSKPGKSVSSENDFEDAVNPFVTNIAPISGEGETDSFWDDIFKDVNIQTEVGAPDNTFVLHFSFGSSDAVEDADEPKITIIAPQKDEVAVVDGENLEDAVEDIASAIDEHKKAVKDLEALIGQINDLITELDEAEMILSPPEQDFPVAPYTPEYNPDAYRDYLYRRPSGYPGVYTQQPSSGFFPHPLFHNHMWQSEPVPNPYYKMGHHLEDY